MRLLARPTRPRRPAGPVGVAVPPRCCWPIPTSISPSGCGIVDELRAPVAGPAAQMLARTAAALRDTRSDARRRRLRRNLRSATAIHDVPDLLDQRRHPQPRARNARLRPGVPRCRLPAAGRRGPRLPAGGARVRGDRRPRCGAAAAGRVPGADRRAARCVDRMPDRRTPTPCPGCARRCRRPPTRRCFGRSGWRRPARPRKRLGCNRSR